MDANQLLAQTVGAPGFPAPRAVSIQGVAGAVPVAVSVVSMARSTQLPGSLGQALSAASLPVVLASDQPAIPVSIVGGLTLSANNVTIGDVVLAGGTANIGHVDGQGVAGTPTGGVVSVQGVGGGTALPVSGTFWQATQPVSAAALPLPTGAATAANQTSEITELTAIAASLAGTLAVSGTFWQATQPVSLASLPALVAGTANIGHIDGQGVAGTPAGGVVSVQGVGGGTALPVSGTFWQATQPVSAAALPLPTGAAQDSSVNGLLLAQGSSTSGQTGPLAQGAVTTSAPSYTTAKTSPLSLTTTGNLRVVDAAIPSLGQAAMASSLPVVIASNQGAVPAALQATSSGAATQIRLANVNATPQAIKTSAGTLYGIYIVNGTGATCWVQIFDAVTGLVTAGSTISNQQYSCGAGATLLILMPAVGVAHTTAITVLSTTALGGGTGSAAGVFVTGFYQ